MRTGRSLPTVWARFLGYLAADGLNYLLGFAIYGWLIRILSDQQYGHLSIASSIYQVLMWVAALGLDLVGARIISDAGGNPIDIADRGQRLRVIVSLVVCAPTILAIGLVYWHRGHTDVATIVFAGFAMVLARAVDVSYVAVALGMPGALCRTRALGLGLYLAALLTCKPIIVRAIWILPVLNAIGLTIGRFQLLRILRSRAHDVCALPGTKIRDFEIIRKGAKAASGQLLLIAYQTLDVVLLAKYVSAEFVGQYAMVSRLYLFGTAVLTCLLNTFIPELVSVATDAKLLARQFKKFLAASVGLGLAGAVFFWLAGSYVCEMLGHRHLGIVRQVVPIYALVFLVMAFCNPFLSFLPSLHRSGTYVAGIATAAMLLGVVDPLLIPSWGVRGAAFGQLVVTLFLTVFGLIVYLHHLRCLRADTFINATKDAAFVREIQPEVITLP